MQNIVSLTVAVVMAVASFGCAGQPVVWNALPASVTANAADTEFIVEPLRQGNAFYSAFRLTARNSGDASVAVDWNRSGYLFNDRPGGALWFDGITAEAIRDRAVPMDAIAPGATLSRVVAPLQFIAITPLKQSTRNQSAFSAGRLPAGRNGVRVVLVRGETASTVSLSVTISAHDAK